MLASWKESYDKPRQHIKKQRHYLSNEGPYNQTYGFPSSHIWMWELDHKEGWTLKNWCIWTVVLENTLESPLDCKEINQSILKEINFEYSLEGLQHFGHLMRTADSLRKILMLGKIEGRGEESNIGWNCWVASPDSMDSQGLFPVGLTGLISLLSKRLSRVFSSITVLKHQFFSTLPS